MTRPRSKGTILFGARTYSTLEVEVLHIGEHPTGYSYKKHVVVALTNDQALDAYERGYDVKVAAKDSKFLGVVQTEHLLYLVIDIPVTFDESDLNIFRLERRLSRGNKATVEVCAQTWERRNYYGEVEVKGVRLHLESLVFIDDITGFEVLKDIEAERNRQRAIFDDYEMYVQSQRDANMPVISRHRWLQLTDPSRISQREFEQRNNRHRTVWAEGDVVGLNGEEYIVGRVTDLDDQWGIRLDLKFKPSAYMRVPK